MAAAFERPDDAAVRARKSISKAVRGLGPSGAPRRHYRTVWISDVHLGTRACSDRILIDFLDHVDCDTLYLVGDIIDAWQLKKRFYWPERHNAVVRRVMKRAKHGTRVIYIPGNHDDMLRQFAGLSFGGVRIMRRAVHETVDGRRLLVLHGDEFDAVVVAHRWFAWLGDAAYDLLLQVNTAVNFIRRRLGRPHWSLALHAKNSMAGAVGFILPFEEAAAHEAARRGADGVVCGHLHTAGTRAVGKVTYYNDGDWVESCTTLVEHDDGRMEIVDWTVEMAARGEPSTERRQVA